jgi:hypothetical protein
MSSHLHSSRIHHPRKPSVSEVNLVFEALQRFHVAIDRKKRSEFFFMTVDDVTLNFFE